MQRAGQWGQSGSGDTGEEVEMHWLIWGVMEREEESRITGLGVGDRQPVVWLTEVVGTGGGCSMRGRQWAQSGHVSFRYLSLFNLKETNYCF